MDPRKIMSRIRSSIVLNNLIFFWVDNDTNSIGSLKNKPGI